MGYDDEEEDTTAQAFAGLKAHVDEYKQYINKLKKGTRSGVSHIFGSAADLLPEKHLEVYLRGDKPFELGESLLKDGADMGILRQAVEKMVLLASDDSAELQIGSLVDGREVIGIFFEDGKKMLLYDDFSMEEAPTRAAEQSAITPTVAEGSSASVPGLDSGSDPAAESSAGPASGPSPGTGSGSAFAPRQTLSSPPIASHPYARLPDPDSEIAISPGHVNRSVDSSLEQDLPAPESTPGPDLHVTTPNGTWLWDIIFEDDAVAQVQMADGTIIQQADADKFVITKPPKPGQKMPQIEIIGAVSADPTTGNLYYQSLAGDQAIALLNNGWRIDQYKKPDDESEYFVTEPLKAGQTVASRIQATSLTIDPETGDIAYDTIDGGAIMTLKCRKLSS